MIELPFAVDAFGGTIAGATLVATMIGAVVAAVKARREGKALETSSLIEVNEYLRGEITDLRSELREAHAEVDEQRNTIDALQLRVGYLRDQIEALDRDLKKALATPNGS